MQTIEQPPPPIEPSPPPYEHEPGLPAQPPDWREQLEKRTRDVNEGMKKEAIEKAIEILEPTVGEQQVVTQEALKKPFVCPYDGKEFDTEMQLKGHMLHHAKQRKAKKEKKK